MTHKHKECLNYLKDAVSKRKAYGVPGIYALIAPTLVRKGILNWRKDKYGSVLYWIRKEGESQTPWDDRRTFVLYGESTRQARAPQVLCRVATRRDWTVDVFPAVKRLAKLLGFKNGSYYVEGTDHQVFESPRNECYILKDGDKDFESRN